MVNAKVLRQFTRSSDQVSPWSLTTLVFALILVGPFVAILVTATGDSGGLWAHLMATVFPRYVANTLWLMLGVGLLSLLFGIVTAWVVARYTFPGAKVLEWALLLPATVPAYIIAYTYTDLLEYAGPVQLFLREIFGWSSVRDYWFPEIRSMGGAILVMASVLYPYIYLLARTAFRLTPASYFEVARLTNRNPVLTVDLPLARPAIIAGLALVLMEVLSDFGTVEFFAVETLTLGIFNVWLGMNNLTAAAQIAGMAFIFILALIVIERRARRRQRFNDTSGRATTLPAIQATGGRAVLCIVICMTPIVLGFVIPAGVLLNFVVKGLAITNIDALLQASINSLSISLISAVAVMAIAAVMILTTTYRKHPIIRALSTISALGYAFPGAILAIGVVSFAGGVDRVAAEFGMSEGFLIGGVGLVVLACIVRFQAVGHGAIASGVNHLSPNIMSASYVLGRSFSNTMITLAPPLLRKSFLTGGILVFVDVMKELPMTLLLRPFNYETLSTYVYQFAKDELLEESALAALMIIVAGLGPVILINASQRDKS
ncbi:MAG: ABC transporter permease [Rhodospirillaceae bacterium]|nr:ABC transporter permease [Rhodospirillaceae bacterium]|tara:strand:+ start:4222 stop:5859 length:1638 start_codon:yes stop_codon:yes gene_type:complete